MGLGEKAESLDRTLPNLLFPPNQRSTCGSEDSPNESHHFYLFTYLFTRSEVPRSNKPAKKLNFSCCKARINSPSSTGRDPAYLTSLRRPHGMSQPQNLPFLVEEVERSTLSRKMERFQQQCAKWRQLSQAKMTSPGITKI